MKVEIISIGDELLIGQVINTNATWMAEQLSVNGFDVSRIQNIKDNENDIVNALDLAKENAEIILISGGLGPTKDDITKKTLAKYFNSKIIFDHKAFDLIKLFFDKRGLEVTELNKRQAEIIAICTPIYNMCGTASGMWIEESDCIFVSMPGVPFEMKAMMEKDIIPKLKNKFDTKTIVHKTMLTTGIGESFLSEIIEEWENSLPENAKLAYLPSPGIVRLRITAIGENEKLLKKTIEEKIEKLQNIIPEYIFGYDNDKLEEIVGKLLKANNKTVSTAESCTGGYIGHLFTSIAGSSEYYNGSIVSYSNDAKISLLNVSREVIDKHGAVSEEVVIEMAKGAKEKLKTDYSIATSGIAGPGGGTTDKPVGTVWIAVAYDRGIIAKKFTFGNNRERNIRMSALSALNLLRKNILSTTKNN